MNTKTLFTIMAMLMVLNQVSAQSSDVSIPPKKQKSIGIDILDGLIYSSFTESSRNLLLLTYKKEINERMRWNLKGGLSWKPENSLNHEKIISSTDSTVTFLRQQDDYGTEFRLSSGLEFTRTKGKFTRYFGADICLRYSVGYSSTYSYMMNNSNPDSIYFIDHTGMPNDYREYKTSNFGIGLSAFYGYEYRLGKHWSLSAEVRLEFMWNYSTEKLIHGTDPGYYNKSRTTFDITMPGFISNVSLNYLFR